MTETRAKNQDNIANKVKQFANRFPLLSYSRNDIILVFFSFFIFLYSHNSFSQENIEALKGKELKNSIRLNFIPVQMPTDFDSNLKSTMGLMGLHYQIPINSWLYGGIGMYGAVTGDQGGLFTLGVELGINKQLYNNLYLDANFHFGGGGGYRYLINDGAFINPNVGLQYKQKKFNFGVQYSHVNFYTGAVKSNSVSFFIEIPSVLKFTDYSNSQKEFVASNLSDANFWKAPVTRNVQQVRFDFFKPIGNSRKDNANNQEPLTETLAVLGFEYQKYISNTTFIFAHTDAIYKGLRAGFMDLFFGAGYHPYQSKNINLFTKFAIGAAGGRIAPEGGLMIYPSAGIDFKISNKIALSSHAGYYRAVAGDLEAYTFGLGVKYLGFNGGTENYTSFKTQGIRIGVQNQTYLDVLKTDHSPVDLQLLGLQVNYDLNTTFYLVGEVGFAYDGKSGGYAHGMAGIGVYSPYFIKNKVRAHFEAMAGAAGGAGVDTGEGVVIRPSVGLSYKLTNTVSLQSSIGKLITPFGELKSTNINIGLSFGLATLSARK
jgi:hypothetical protein